MSTDINCPVCGAEFDMAIAFSSEADRRALKRFVQTCVPIGDRVMHYLTLFTPPKQRLTASKKLKLIMQLLPDLERQTIGWKGRDWLAPLTIWAQAIDDMIASRDAGTLDLPMKSHGYLYAILARLSARDEAQAEQQREAERRTAPRRDTVQVRGQTFSIGEGLQAAYGGKDPALAKLDDDTRNAAPMPSGVRELTERLKRGQG